MQVSSLGCISPVNDCVVLRPKVHNILEKKLAAEDEKIKKDRREARVSFDNDQLRALRRQDMERERKRLDKLASQRETLPQALGGAGTE